jgi:hypothetical protein
MLFERMPRQLTSLEDGLRTYFGATST